MKKEILKEMWNKNKSKIIKDARLIIEEMEKEDPNFISVGVNAQIIRNRADALYTLTNLMS